MLLAVLLCGCSQTHQVVIHSQPTQGRTAIELPTTTPQPPPPTPTFVSTAGGESTAAPPPLATPTVVADASTVAAAPPASTANGNAGVSTNGGATPAGVAAGGTSFRLEDTAWVGGWRNKGDSRYKGRTATWIYGVNTAYNTMRATFTLSGRPTGQSQLQVEGMDSEGEAKTLILVEVNGQQIFRGPNPLPNDENNLPSGTWGMARFPFAATLLQPGSNTITIQTLVNGQFGQPPFFMLDYADLVLGP